MYVIASFGVWANFNRYNTIGNLRLQKAETPNFAQARIFSFEFMIPMLYNFSSNYSTSLIRNGSDDYKSLILDIIDVTNPQMRLYLILN